LVKTVIIIEDDLGFAFWLGHTLDRAGYNALPAVNVASASSLLAELAISVDLVVINAAVESAASFISELRLTQPACKVIALLGNPDDLPPAFDYADLAEHKPESIDETSQTDWIDTVRMVLSPRAFGF
jgi:DNA-binding NtrC family response regulator